MQGSQEHQTAFQDWAGPMRRAGSAAGVALVQVIMAMGMIAICGAAGIVALDQMNNKAAAMRVLNNARAVVERNIDASLGVPFSASLQPAILNLTGTGGAVYDDDGNGDNMVDLVTPVTAGGPVVRGTLTRTVLAVANAEGATLRRVTFRLNHTYRQRPYSVEMSTVRAMD